METITYEGRAYELESPNGFIFLSLDTYEVSDHDPDNGDTIVVADGEEFIIPGAALKDYARSVW